MLLVLHAMFEILEYTKLSCDRADGSLYWNSQKWFIRHQIGAGICAVLTGEAVRICVKSVMLSKQVRLD